MKIILSLLLLGASGLCCAAEPEFTKQYDACMESAGGVTASMLDCIGAETRRQDAMLNAQYKAAMQATPKARQPKLKAAQRNWVKFRDADCDFYNDAGGGTIVAVDVAGCVLNRTAERAKDLESIAAMMSVR